MNIYAIKCDDGRFFINENDSVEGSYSRTFIEGFLFDGKTPEKSFCDRWFIIKQEPKIIQKSVRQPNINHRYELVDKEMVSAKIPLVLKREDVAEYSDNYWSWKKDFLHLESLYKMVYDEQPDKLEDVDFKFIIIMSVKDVPTPEKFIYYVEKASINNDNIINQLIDRLVFPAPILPQRPCMLSSNDTYKIVRAYIKNNINPMVAEITSDYDFCFTVKKRIAFCEPTKYQTDVNWSIFGRKKKPNIVTRYRTERLVECFEMTNEKSKYSNYTVIKGVEGLNSDDLKEKLDDYLKKLILFINTPLKDCPTCKGCGVIIPEKTVKA